MNNQRGVQELVGIASSGFIPLACVGLLGARFANRERSRDALDKLIAAHAIAIGVTLVTNKESDFAVYPGRSVENWVNRR